MRVSDMTLRPDLTLGEIMYTYTTLGTMSFG